MDIQALLFIVWAVVTIVFLGLVYYRFRITRKETDWIPLSDDGKEAQAIEAQKVSETRSHKLDFPIRALGAASALIIVVMIGVWFYHGITTPPPISR
jgi:cbb3-type cytochrome oxidase subunit 3